MRRSRRSDRPRRAPSGVRLAAVTVLAGSIAAGCGGAGGAANRAATATTFTIDSPTVAALTRVVDQANLAALLAASGRGGTAVTACRDAWQGARAKVAAHDVQTVTTLDAAVVALGTAVRSRDATAAGDAATTIATGVARYVRLYP